MTDQPDTEDYETITIDISEDEKQQLISVYVDSNLGKTSSDYFYQLLADGKDFNTALSAAIFNEITIQALTTFMEENKLDE